MRFGHLWSWCVFWHNMHLDPTIALVDVCSSQCTAAVVLNTLALFLLKSFRFLLSLHNSDERRVWMEVTGLQATSAANRNTAKSVKVGNSLLFIRVFVTWRFHLAAAQSDSFYISLWFTSQSFKVSRPFTWGIASQQAFMKSAKFLSPSASLDFIFGQLDSFSEFGLTRSL